MAVWDFFLNVQHTGCKLTAVNLVKQLSVHLLNILVGFPCVSASKESTCNVGDLGLILGLGSFPGGGHGNPLQYSFLENPHGQKSLVGYSPWGCKELDTTE